MKIALVCPYDFSRPGGVKVHISYLARHLRELGHEVKILTSASLPHALEEEEVICVGRPRRVELSSTTVYAAPFPELLFSPQLAELREMLEREKFDLFHLHEPLFPSLPALVLLFSRGINVGTFHSFESGGFAYSLFKPFFKQWFEKLDGRIAVSKPACDFITRFFPGDYRIIPNGVDTSLFSPSAPPMSFFRDHKLNILFVGRMDKRKGLDLLLGAFRRVKERIPRSRLIIVGSGTRRQRERYERLAGRYRLQDVVFIRGPVPYLELPRWYNTADVFCSPAREKESFGIVLLEAMACGKPVVATSIEGYKYLVEEGKEGLLVEPREEALAEGLVKLLEAPELRREIGIRGREKAERFDWRRIALQVNQYYEEIAEKKR